MTKFTDYRKYWRQVLPKATVIIQIISKITLLIFSAFLIYKLIIKKLIQNFDKLYLNWSSMKVKYVIIVIIIIISKIDGL